jgi:hypothetical protein
MRPLDNPAAHSPQGHRGPFRPEILLQYAIPLTEMKRLLERRGRTLPADFATAKTARGALALIPMNIKNPTANGLTAYEKRAVGNAARKARRCAGRRLVRGAVGA